MLQNFIDGVKIPFNSDATVPSAVAKSGFYTALAGGVALGTFLTARKAAAVYDLPASEVRGSVTYFGVIPKI